MEDALNAGHCVEFFKETQLCAEVAGISVDNNAKSGNPLYFALRFSRLRESFPPALVSSSVPSAAISMKLATLVLRRLSPVHVSGQIRKILSSIIWPKL